MASERGGRQTWSAMLTIGFVADGRDDGDVAGEDGAGDGLLVVGPEILGRAAASGDDDQVGFVNSQAVESLNALGD